jgi:hypothetical protein
LSLLIFHLLSLLPTLLLSLLLSLLFVAAVALALAVAVVVDVAFYTLSSAKAGKRGVRTTCSVGSPEARLNSVGIVFASC